MRRECPKCGSTDILTERRPNGNSTCQKCGHSEKTAIFDEHQLKELKKLSDKLDLASGKRPDSVTTVSELPKCKCGQSVEDFRYEFCYECWWDQDPRNVKNGGTVDLDKYKTKENVRKVTFYMKSGKKYSHLTSHMDEHEAVKAMRGDVIGLETDNKGFATYKVEDIERIEIREV